LHALPPDPKSQHSWPRAELQSASVEQDGTQVVAQTPGPPPPDPDEEPPLEEEVPPLEDELPPELDPFVPSSPPSGLELPVVAVPPHWSATSETIETPSTAQSFFMDSPLPILRSHRQRFGAPAKVEASAGKPAST
jgi:hypothetical protein